MDKIIDRQNKRTGSFNALTPKERRARMEVTLGPEELHGRGIRRFSDLRSFRFGTLQGHYFKTMLPTFKTVFSSEHEAVEKALEKDRRTKFLNTGILGLSLMDAAKLDFGKGERKMVVQVLRHLGKVALQMNRRGTGATGTLVAYKELGRRIETALRMLGERESVSGA